MPPKNKNNYGRLFGEALYVLGLPYLFVAGFFGVFLAFVGFGYNPFWASWLSGVVMNTQRYFRYAVLRPARLVLFVGYSIPVVMFFWLPVGWGVVGELA